MTRQVSPRALISDTGLAPLVDAAAGEFPGLTVLDCDELVGGAPAGSADELAEAGVGPDDLAVLIPTSGTTGRSKLVMQTHRTYAMAGEGFGFWMELTAADRLMTSLPLFHINAPAYSVMGSLAAARAWCCCRGSRPAGSSTPLAGTVRPSSTRSGPCWRS
jgi:crotonobetaine/carnitine-CoA ligase